MSYFTQIKVIDNTGNLAEVTPYGEMHTIEPVRIAGSIFNDGVVDTSFFTVTNTAGGTTTVANSAATLATNTTANGATRIQTAQAARFVGGTNNRFLGRLALGDTGTANNVRRWGTLGPGATNGIYFKLNGTATLVAATLRGGTETTYALTLPSGFSLTNLNLYEIDYSSGEAYFIINNQVAYALIATTQIVYNEQMYGFIDNTNSGGSTTNVTLSAVNLAAYRLGRLTTQAISGHLTTAGTYILKYGPGLLQRVTIGTPATSTSTITLYDNTAGSGTVISAINGPSQANPVTLEYGLAFSTGLTAVVTGTWDASVIFE